MRKETQLEAFALNTSEYTPITSFIRAKLRSDNDRLVNKLEDVLIPTFKNFCVSSRMYRYMRRDLMTNIADTLSVVVMDHILYGVCDRGYDKVLISLTRDYLLNEIRFKQKHMEMLFGCDLADVIDDMGDTLVVQKVLRQYLMELNYFENSGVDIKMSAIKFLNRLTRYNEINLKRFAGCTITPNRLFLIFIRSNNNGTDNIRRY